jgi:hypothetical protein
MISFHAISHHRHVGVERAAQQIAIALSEVGDAHDVVVNIAIEWQQAGRNQGKLAATRAQDYFTLAAGDTPQTQHTTLQIHDFFEDCFIRTV